MGNKKSDMQRMINIAMEASQEKLDGIVETLVSIRNKRFPRKPRQKQSVLKRTTPSAEKQASSNEDQKSE